MSGFVRTVWHQSSSARVAAVACAATPPPAGGGVAAHATAATRALLDWCQTVRTKPDTHHKSGAHEFLCHKIIVGTLPLPFYIPGHWDDRSSQWPGM